MTVAATDRLVHHSTIFELNVESYRRRNASDKKAAPDKLIAVWPDFTVDALRVRPSSKSDRASLLSELES